MKSSTSLKNACLYNVAYVGYMLQLKNLHFDAGSIKKAYNQYTLQQI